MPGDGVSASISGWSCYWGQRLDLTTVLARRGLTAVPFTGESPPSALTPAFATRVSECLRELRSGKVSSVLISGLPETGHRRVIAALLERFGRDGDMVAWFDHYPDSADVFLQTLLRKWGLDVEDSAEDELKALVELFIGHQAGKGQLAYVCLPADELPGEEVEALVRWLVGLRYNGEFTVRLVLLGLPDRALPEFLRGGSPEAAAARGLAHHQAPGLEPAELEHYVHTRLKLAGLNTPAQTIPVELCRLAGAYADGEIPLLNRLMLEALERAASEGDGALVVRQAHIESAAEALGLELQSETLSADGQPTDEQPENDQAVLVFSAGGAITHQVELTRERMVMGRDGDCDIPLDSRFISRFQCLFMGTPRGWYVLDLASTNGTFVNARRIREHLLRDGDVIAIGRHQVRFVQGGDVPDDDESPQYLSTEMLVSRNALRAAAADDSGSIDRRGGAPS